jgi:hypothetical protein
MRAAKVFRTIWRINAIVILLAAVALLAAIVSVTAGSMFRGDARDVQPVVAAPDQKEHLHLRPLQAVEGTTVLRGDLVVETGKVMYSSSGDAGQTRNILTIDIPTGKATWLFPTHGQVVETTYRLEQDEKTPQDERKPLADVFLVKALRDGNQEPQGRIVIIDPTARRSAVVAEHVTSLDSASVINGAATIVCQRGGRYVVITADPLALVKLTEREVSIPQLR